MLETENEYSNLNPDNDWNGSNKVVNDLLKNSKPLPKEIGECVDENFVELI